MGGRPLFGCVAIAVASLAAIAGCGGADETTTVTTTGAALQDCPDSTTPAGPVTTVQATDCSVVSGLAGDVLSRDDCVEETPGGANECTAQGYDCDTTIEDRNAASFFVVSCQSGVDQVRFESEVSPSGEGAVTTDNPPEPEAEALTSFSSPSGNIGCVMDPKYVRCDIAERSWEPPHPPPGCPTDFGQGLEISGRGHAALVCAGDTALGGEATLDYGTSSEVGPYACTSEEEGMTCEDSRTGHGFFLSKQGYDAY